MRKFIKNLICELLRNPRVCLRNLFVNERDAGLWRKVSKENGTILLRPKNIDGIFFADIRSDIALRILISGAYEVEELNHVKELKPKLARYSNNSRIVNVGANIGLVSVFLAQHLQHRVVALEPNKEAFDLLTQNIKINHLEDKIEAMQVCIGEKEGTMSFSTIPGKPEYSSIGGIVEPSVQKDKQNESMVSVMPLTKLITDQIAMLFVDVEGAEEMVFRGAEDIIVRDHPIIVSECSAMLLSKSGSSVRKVYDFLISKGYVILDAETRKEFIKGSDFEKFNGNIIALPH